MNATQLEVRNPFDQTLIESLPLHTEAELEGMLERGEQAGRRKPLPVLERMQVLCRFADQVRERKHELALQAAGEGGKPLGDSLVELERGIEGVLNAIEVLRTDQGEVIPMGITAASMGRTAFTQREPIGLVVAISAFNHPFNLIIHQVIPAVATGCPVIVKPASTTPLSARSIVEMLHKAGLPEDLCQLAFCGGRQAEKLATDARVRFFSFIGSGAVGWMLKGKLAPGTRCALEHGGVAPVIVRDDADLDALIPALAKGGYYHAGQVCVSVQKVYVHRSLAESVGERLSEACRSLIVGSPTEERTQVGPLIQSKEVERVAEWVKTAQEQHGARLLCGGERISESCYQPTVLFNPDEKADVSQKEVFGPVTSIYPFDTDQEAVSRANSLPFAFQAAVFSNHITAAMRVMRDLKASAVMLNDHTAFRVDWMPFAGYQQSGYGVGGIPHTMRDMAPEKMYVLNIGND